MRLFIHFRNCIFRKHHVWLITKQHNIIINTSGVMMEGDCVTTTITMTRKWVSQVGGWIQSHSIFPFYGSEYHFWSRTLRDCIIRDFTGVLDVIAWKKGQSHIINLNKTFPFCSVMRRCSVFSCHRRPRQLQNRAEAMVHIRVHI